MTQKEKDLVLKDLCARLPYGVWAEARLKCSSSSTSWLVDELLIRSFKRGTFDFYKPYLFPLSSMTEKQAIELFNIFGISFVDSVGANYIKVNEVTGITFFFQNGFDVETHLDKLINWLNKNHIDWRGLIPMGLAIDATGLNIY